MKSSALDERFYSEPAGTFADGELLQRAPDLSSAVDDPGNGYWHCNIGRHDRLTWSEKVYELFGLPAGAPIEREWAVARYSESSRKTLEHLRRVGLDQRAGFILDAKIRPDGTVERWIRVVAVPIVAGIQVIGLHGLKRAL
jgi:hypothetical protein